LGVLAAISLGAAAIQNEPALSVRMSAKRAIYFAPEAEEVYMAYDDNPFTLPPDLELSVEDAKRSA